MKAIVISVGDELTSGQTIDSNSAWISSRLLRAGVQTLSHVTVRDQLTEIGDALREASGRSELIVVTGGLGPTADDLTRQSLAAAMGVELVPHPPSLEAIEAFFRARGRRMDPSNRAQAMMPAGAEAIGNPLGTAPGIRARLGQAEVFVLPGVPSEMKRMYADAIEPVLAAGAGLIVVRVVHTFGLGESDVGAALSDLMQRDANPRVGTTVAGGVVSVRIVASSAAGQTAQQLAERTLADVCRRLGNLVVGVDDQTMPSVLGDLLRARQETLATAESCTGGLVGQLITSVAGSSDYYLGGVVAYANAVKTDLLGVDESLLRRHGAVSEEVAREMAMRCRERFGATWALSITGIAGPGGGSQEKPAGLVYVGLAGPSQATRGQACPPYAPGLGADGSLASAQVWRMMLPGEREMVRLRAALCALDKLRLKLLETQRPR